MKTKVENVFPHLLLLAILSFFASGCLLVEHDDYSRGAKLSSAMHASASEDHRDIGGSAGSVSTSEISVDTDSGPARDHGSEVAGREPKQGVAATEEEGLSAPEKFTVPIDAAYAIPLCGDFQGLTRFNAAVVLVEGRRDQLDISVGGSNVDLKHGTLLDQATENPIILQLGVSYRRYLSGSRTAFSPYLTAGLGYGAYFWCYRSSVISGGDSISWDLLNTVEGYVGFGITTRRASNVSFFGEIDLGGTTFLGETLRGFENDVLHDFGYYSFKAGVTFKF